MKKAESVFSEGCLTVRKAGASSPKSTSRCIPSAGREPSRRFDDNTLRAVMLLDGSCPAGQVHADWCSVLTTAQRLDAQPVMQIWLDSSSLVTKGLPMSVPEYGALLSDHVRALSEARFHRRV